MSDSSSNHPPQATSPQVPSQPQPGSSGAPAADSDSRVVKAVLITVAVFVGLGVIGVGAIAFGVWYLAKSTHKDANGQVTMSTPFGTIHTVPTATFTERDLGIAIYPGAEPSKSGARIEMRGSTSVNAAYFTADPVDQVIAFYKDKAGPNATLITNARGSEFRLSSALGITTTVNIERNPDASGGRTRIRITHITQTAASP